MSHSHVQLRLLESCLHIAGLDDGIPGRLRLPLRPWRWHPCRVYAYTSDGGEDADEGGEAAKPAENDFQARLAMFKLKETGGAAADAA